MKYMLMLHDDETKWETMSDAEKGEVFGAYMAYTDEVTAAGAYLAGAPLEPTAVGARVMLRDGKRSVQDGPFTDSKEQLGGYYLLEAKDLDEALDWAAKCPCASHGTVEVRPVMDVPSE